MSTVTPANTTADPAVPTARERTLRIDALTDLILMSRHDEQRIVDA